MESKIASYQEPGCRMQLIKVWELDYPSFPGEETKEILKYQIRKNRKILCTLKWETPARQKFNALIRQHLLQTSINYEEKEQ